MHASIKFGVPAAYGVTFLTLLVRDPHCIFAQWEVATKDMQKASERLGGELGAARLVLRITDITDGGESSFDIDVDGQQSRYIHLHEAGRTLRAAIGFKDAAYPHAVVMVARSNVVHTPPGRPSNVFESTWTGPGLWPTMRGYRRGYATVRKTTTPIDLFWDGTVSAFSPGYGKKERGN